MIFMQGVLCAKITNSDAASGAMQEEVCAAARKDESRGLPILNPFGIYWWISQIDGISSFITHCGC
jgi:hypothetical protein